MATVPVQNAPVTGLDGVSFQAADSAGDEVASGPGVLLLVRNEDTSSHTATVTTTATVRNLAVEDPQLVVAASGMGAMSLIRGVVGSTAAVSYDDVTSVSVAAVRVGA